MTDPPVPPCSCGTTFTDTLYATARARMLNHQTDNPDHTTTPEEMS